MATRLGICGIIVLLACAPLARADQVFDLATDWSNTSNPNTGSYGTWQYNAGSTPLSPITAWAAVSSVAVQGWGPSQNVSGDYLPFWFQVTSTELSASTFAGYGAVAGDVLVHSTDQANGVNPTSGDENGPANVTWTSPVSGLATISGSLWTPSFAYPTRQNDYQLILNPGASQTLLTSGTIPEDGSNTLADPITFNIPGVSINTGDVLELEIYQDASSPYGYVTGVDLTIDVASSVPLPAGACSGLVLLSALGFLKLRRCRPTTA